MVFFLSFNVKNNCSEQLSESFSKRVTGISEIKKETWMEEEPHKKKQESVEVELKISTQKEGYIIREGE